MSKKESLFDQWYYGVQMERLQAQWNEIFWKAYYSVPADWYREG